MHDLIPGGQELDHMFLTHSIEGPVNIIHFVLIEGHSQMPFNASHGVRLDSDIASPPSTGLVKENSGPQSAAKQASCIIQDRKKTLKGLKAPGCREGRQSDVGSCT